MNNSKCLFRGVAAVFMPVRELDKSIEWYAKNLGFVLQFKHAAYKAAGIRCGNHMPSLCLVQVHEYKPVEFPQNDFGCDIFYNFIVEDIDQVHTDLTQKGVEVTEIHTSLDSSFRHFSAWDIDGNLLSIVNG